MFRFARLLANGVLGQELVVMAGMVFVEEREQTRDRSTAGERDGDPGQTRRTSIPHNRRLLVVESSPGRDMDAAPGPRRASDIHPSILLSLEELAAVWAARPVACRPDEVLQAPVSGNSHHVGHEGSECDDRHRDDVRLRWHGWMQGPWSVWQMPIPEPMRLVQSPRPSPPCPQIREPTPPAPSLQARGPTCNRFAAGCGQPVAWPLALGALPAGGCCIAAVGQPLTPCRRLPPGVRAVNLSQSEIAIQLCHLYKSILSSLNAPVAGSLQIPSATDAKSRSSSLNLNLTFSSLRTRLDRTGSRPRCLMFPRRMILLLFSRRDARQGSRHTQPAGTNPLLSVSQPYCQFSPPQNMGRLPFQHQHPSSSHAAKGRCPFPVLLSPRLVLFMRHVPTSELFVPTLDASPLTVATDDSTVRGILTSPDSTQTVDPGMVMVLWIWSCFVSRPWPQGTRRVDRASQTTFALEPVASTSWAMGNSMSRGMI